MNTRDLVGIAVAAVVVVALILVVPDLGSRGDGTAGTSSTGGGDAPAISDGDTLPSDRPDVGSSSSGAGTDVSSNAALQDAIDAAEKAYEAYPENVDDVLSLAGLYLQGNRLDDAGNLYEDALQLNPGNVAASLGLGMIGLDNGQVDGAGERIEKVVKDNPESQLAHYNLAIVYFSADEREAAQAECCLLYTSPSPRD